MKNAIICMVLLTAIGCPNVQAGPQENKALFDQINLHWKNRSYTEIWSIVDARQQANADDVLALTIKMYYHVFAVKDITRAHQVAAQLNLQVQASSNQRFKDLGAEMIKRVTDIPTTENSPWTLDQQNALHASMDKYPFIQECFVLWGLATSQLQ